jgi:tetratricopeptide (TPR) repeat protein
MKEVKTGLSAEQLHSKGAQFREEDKHQEALQYLTVAIVAYQDVGNFAGLIDALKDRTLTWKHYFLLTKDKVYAILARKDAEAMLAIAEQYDLNDKLDTAYFRLGEIDMLFEDYPGAINHYQKALDTYRGPLSEKGDFRYHLGEAYYRNGEKGKGKRLILEGLKEIQDGADELDPFLIHVWESGVYIRLAELLIKDEPPVAKEYYQEAKKIAEADPKLVIRRRQIAELGKRIKAL